MNENDIHRILNDDANLREAVNRREQQQPPIPAHLNERLIQRIGQEDKQPQSRRVWLYAAIGAVAAGLLLLLVLRLQVKPEEQLIAEQPVQQPVATNEVEEQTPEPMIVQETPVEPQVAQIVQPVKVKRHKKRRVPSVDVAAQADIQANAEEALPEPQVQMPDVMPDPFLAAEMHAQQIHARGMRLYQEIEQQIKN